MLSTLTLFGVVAAHQGSTASLPIFSLLQKPSESRVGRKLTEWELQPQRGKPDELFETTS
jgi:hypothetical protein